MTAPRITLDELRATAVADAECPCGTHLTKLAPDKVLALVAAVEAASAYLMYPGTPSRRALRAALAPFVAEEKP